LENVEMYLMSRETCLTVEIFIKVSILDFHAAFNNLNYRE